MKVSVNLIFTIFLLHLSNSIHASQGFLRLVRGSIYLKSDSRKAWSQINADISIRIDDIWKTSSNFAGTLYYQDQSSELISNSTYHFRQDGLFKLQGQSWYPLSVKSDESSKIPKESSSVTLRGQLKPESYVLLTRGDQADTKKIGQIFDVYQGDFIELPSSHRAEFIMADGSRLNFDAGSRVEIGYEGIYLKSGSVFCNIRRQLSRFEVTTPYALVSVRGTVFEVSHHKATQVNVYEGVVKVSDRSSRNNSSVFLEQGQGSIIGDHQNNLIKQSFDTSKLPLYASSFSPTVNHEQKVKDSKRLKAERIQAQLRQAKADGFQEYISENYSAKDSSKEVNSDQVQVVDNSLQAYLQRVANTGEDSDFRIFKGGQAVSSEIKMVESWKDEYREGVQKSTAIQRQKVDSLGEDFKDRRSLADYRNENIAVDLKTQVLQNDFDRRKFEGGIKELDDKSSENRELLNVRKYINLQNLELRRIQTEKIRLVRDKDLIENKEERILDSIDRNPDQESSLRISLRALQDQKHHLDIQQKNLNTRENNVLSLIQKANDRISAILRGYAGKLGSDGKFIRDSRRLLMGQ